MQDDLASGRLVPAHRLTAPNGEAYYLASAADAPANPDMTAFRTWLLSRGNVGRPEPALA